jgi:uncharacterized protein (DUF1684 family)
VRPAILLLLVMTLGCGGDRSAPGARVAEDPQAYIRSVLERRAEKEKFFKDDSQSPAPPDQRASTPPPTYFPVDPSWVLRLPFERYPRPERLMLITNTGEGRGYLKIGQVSFEREGKPLRLQMYREIETGREGGALWVPFIDAAAGKETYPAGRYLDAEIQPDGTVILDFNLAYNPYCAYGWRGYSCPLTPRENRLPIGVRAGEKGFHS